MKVLILTQYFPPEVGAPQNRLYELAVRMQRKGAEVTILTAMPNYPQMKVYKGYRGKLYHHEEMSGLKVHRSWIYVTTARSIFPRLLNYFSFVITSFLTGLFRTGKQDIILCESPPLFLGISAWLLKIFKGSKMIFNVSDLWPESAEKLGLVTNRSLLRFATSLEEFLYKKSWLITGQTQGIVKNISNRFPQKRVHWLPNGVDLSFYNYGSNHSSLNWRGSNGFSADDFILLYAGIIGHAQGLEVILNAAALLKENKELKFVLLGSGPEKEKLIKLKNELSLNNVFFLDTVSKNEMPVVLSSINVSIIPLKKLDLFLGAIPSKIFESLAMKRPLLLGVEGEAKSLFIDQGKCGLAFSPEDYSDLAEKGTQLFNDKQLCTDLGDNGLKYVQEYFTRDKIADEFWTVINTDNT